LFYFSFISPCATGFTVETRYELRVTAPRSVAAVYLQIASSAWFRTDKTVSGGLCSRYNLKNQKDILSIAPDSENCILR